jgi:vacuolar-type H+-ATPase subunit H
MRIGGLRVDRECGSARRPARGAWMSGGELARGASHRGSAGGTVVSDAIRRIRDAERDAEEAVRRARAEATRLLADAHEAAERLLEQAQREGREEERRLVEAARAEADGQAVKLAAESKRAVESTRQSAGEKVKAGVKRALDAVTS